VGLVPVGEVVAGVRQVGPERLQRLLGEVAQPLRGVPVGGLAEVLVEVGCRDEYVAQGRQDTVVRGSQLGQDASGVVRGGGLTEPIGEVSDLGAQRAVRQRAAVGVKRLVAVDVVADRAQPGHRTGGDALFGGLVETGGQAVVALVESGDEDEPGALKDAVGFGVSAAGENFAGMYIAPAGQQAVGQGQRAGTF
jgi:hypothetical protein